MDEGSQVIKGIGMRKTKRVVLLALMIAQALILSIIESWIPMPVAIPGIKLGLANIITLVAIIFFDWKDAVAVVVARCILSSIFGGGFVVFLFSLSGGILSTVVMSVLYKRMPKSFSLIGISIAGAISHNIGQLAAASVIMKELSVFAYLPVLLISGIIMGCFVGLCSSYLSKALRKTGIFI